jgi:hypothetical protein
MTSVLLKILPGIPSQIATFEMVAREKAQLDLAGLLPGRLPSVHL